MLRALRCAAQAVLLACEDGKRLYPLVTQDCPAPLLPVLNKPLLHYQLELLEKAGYTGVVILRPWLCCGTEPYLVAWVDRSVRLHLGFSLFLL